MKKIVIIILLIGLFFRFYQPISRFDFAHDGDLYSWIVKDIVANHHLRLIGQLTSAPGIFIGPLYYYLLIPFFLIFNMDPIGALILATIIGISTILSYYFVFTKLYNKYIGLFGSFLYAVSLHIVSLDRMVVPTILTNLWSIWYLYTIVNIARGNFKLIPLLGVLISLIWHIHIALAPTLIAIPAALFFAKKMPKPKEIIIFLLITVVTSLPLIIFESRHNFQQTKSLVQNFTANFGTTNTTSETRKILLGSKNDNAALNLNPSSKFSLEIQPQTPNPGDKVNIKITGKNTKYSTLIINLNCGDPQKFEIGAITGEFTWSSKGCKEHQQDINITGRTLISSFKEKSLDKLLIVFEKENNNIISMFVSPLELGNFKIIFSLLILLTPFIAWKLKTFNRNEVIIFYSWILGVFLFFSFSSIPVSEYYLASLDVILLLSVSSILLKIYQKHSIGKYFVYLLLSAFFIRNLIFIINLDTYHKGYVERKATAFYIASDARIKNYPCIGISYITAPGENVGFRYFFWLNKLRLTHPGLDVPVYNIIIPDELSKDEIDKKFGHIGVIVPKKAPSNSTLEKLCHAEDTNLTDPLLGYTQ